MIYACPDCFDEYIIDSNRYESFLYYTRLGMEDGEWMFLDETFWNEAFDFIAHNRGKYSLPSIIELENDCIRRCNMVLHWPTQYRFQENAKEALHREKRYRGIPRFDLCQKEDIKALFSHDYCNFEALRSFDSTKAFTGAADFLYTVALVGHLEELAQHYPRILFNPKEVQFLQSYCRDLLGHFTKKKFYPKTENSCKQLRLAKRVFRTVTFEKKGDFYEK